MGEIIDGKYEVLREVGRGGMSIVYLAMDRRLNKQWAIKEFRKDKDDANKQVALKALLDEANLMKKFDHPTLPRIVDIIEQTDTVYVVMDYIEGESLNKVLDAYGAQPQEAVIEWAKQLSEVLDYLHTQNPPVIYRDMKPANIMLKPDGTVRLIDFGIAREYKEGKEGDTEAIGTRGYAAPEQFGGRGQTDARTDIYSLGVTLYHLVTGKNPAEPPYEIYPIRHWDASLSSGLEWMIQKCTQLNPGDRYQSCAEITYVLENIDKFETEYKKKLKRKINMFIASASLTLVFTIGSIGSFVGANTIKSNTYNSLIEAGENGDISSYEQAIEQDETRPEAYEGLAKYVNDKKKIYSDNYDGITDDDITDSDIITWFSGEFDDIKENYPEEYVDICYKIGLNYWINYQDSSESVKASASKAQLYFKKTLETAQNNDGKDYVGLNAKQYNLAKINYMLSCFMEFEKMDQNYDGEFQISDEFAATLIPGVENGAMENPYYSYWQVCNEVLETLGSKDEEVTNDFRVETLKKLIYILQINEDKFYTQTHSTDNSIESSDMEAYVKSLKEVIGNITDSSYEESVKELKDSLNNTISKINADKNYNIELEEIV